MESVRARDLVRLRREQLNLTQAMLAERCGCHPTTVSQIEKARMLPSLELFARLAQELKVSPARLLSALMLAHQNGAAPLAAVTSLQGERERREGRSKLDH